jgi:hypothetical protein
MAFLLVHPSFLRLAAHKGKKSRDTLVVASISIWMLVTPLPVFLLLLGFELGELAFRLMLRFQPLLVGAVLSVIPLMVVIVFFIVVSLGLVVSGL